MKVILCWCCPPDTAIAIYREDPCKYPDCPNSEMPDPRDFYETKKQPDEVKP